MVGNPLGSLKDIRFGRFLGGNRGWWKIPSARPKSGRHCREQIGWLQSEVSHTFSLLVNGNNVI